MSEFLRNAWPGWTGYMDHGKLPALLMAVLLFLWFGRRQKEQEMLLTYTSIMAVCCILPVTASVLMLYQTKFYNYEWIWSLVPMTAVTAYGLTVFWTEYRMENEGQWKKILPVTLLLLATLVFCGSLGRETWDRKKERQERDGAYAVVDRLSEKYPGAELCLWAPREIMEYARERDASIRLPYGRNIWDAFLNAYSYDIYEEDIVILEEWMENVSITGEAELEIQAGEAFREHGAAGDREAAGGESGLLTQEGGGGNDDRLAVLEECVAIAGNRGVNCILIPAGAASETVARMEKALGMGGELFEGYYLFFTGEEAEDGRTD